MKVGTAATLEARALVAATGGESMTPRFWFLVPVGEIGNLQPGALATRVPGGKLMVTEPDLSAFDTFPPSKH